MAPEHPAPARENVTPWVWTSFWTVAASASPVFAITFAVVGARLTEMGRTVKAAPLLGWLPTVTTTFPLVAPVGILNVMVDRSQVVGVITVPLNETVPDPCVMPKPVPVTVTAVP